MIADARATQLATAEAKAQKYADAYRLGYTRLDDWRYVPPVADEWSAWRGATKLWALDYRYRWHNVREAELRTGAGPFYCPVCETRPGRGWKAANCLDCDWDGYLAEEVLARARSWGREWLEAGWRVSPEGKVYNVNVA